MKYEHITPPKPPHTDLQLGINNADEYEAATQRVRTLADCSEGSKEAKEMAALVQAIMDWDRGHDDATAWQ